MGWDGALSCLYFNGVLSFRGRKSWESFFVNLHCGIRVFSDCVLLRGGCRAGGSDQNFVFTVIYRELDR